MDFGALSVKWGVAWKKSLQVKSDELLNFQLFSWYKLANKKEELLLPCLSFQVQ